MRRVFGLTGNPGRVGVPLIAPLGWQSVDPAAVWPRHRYPPLPTFGLSYVFVDAMMVFAGLPFTRPRCCRALYGIDTSAYRLFLIGAMTVMVTGLWLFLEKTSYGLVIRAGARDSEIVRVLGIDISRVWMGVFGIGTAAAGIAGYLSAPMQSVIPEMGIPVLVQAFVVTVVGGMGSLVGAVIAGLLVGVVTSITVMIAPQLADAAMFGLMAVVLLLRPQGLFGRRGLME
jgi:branched-chain amino acid transport system permease protein